MQMSKKYAVVGCVLAVAVIILPAFRALAEEGEWEAEVVDSASLFPDLDYSGDLMSRIRLTGDWGGLRSDLADKGLSFDINLTNTGQGVVDGGLDEEYEYVGSFDLTTNLDFEKLGLWPGAFMIITAEAQFGDGVLWEAGTLLPVNYDALFPEADDGIALSEVTFIQFLSETLGVVVGKLLTIDGDANEFAHGGNNDKFMNTAFGANPVTFLTVPYSTLGAGILYLPTERIETSLAVIDSEGEATTSGFDTVFDDGTTVTFEGRIAIDVKGRPGHQLVGASWSNKDFTSLESRVPVPPPIGEGGPLELADDSWSFFYNFDQYLHVEADDPSQGWGLFGRFGIADGDTNPAERFYSIGVGGKGVIPTRDNDTFGLGYFYAELSDELPDIVTRFFDDEQGVELFYNVEVTPWMHLTPDIQVIDPGRKGADTAVVLGLRGKVDL
jgi:porin